jgi:hypothetical protein
MGSGSIPSSPAKNKCLVPWPVVLWGQFIASIVFWKIALGSCMKNSCMETSVTVSVLMKLLLTLGREEIKLAVSLPPPKKKINCKRGQVRLHLGTVEETQRKSTKHTPAQLFSNYSEFIEKDQLV